ncbi:hypothetical protein BCAR13_1360023 [Paraburkholderia caribensis]|nr:hypothetical protein BCAR13_1360023 [Paraburkholderia caribensis]
MRHRLAKLLARVVGVEHGRTLHIGHVCGSCTVVAANRPLARDDCVRDDPMHQAYGMPRMNKIRVSDTQVGALPDPSKGFTRLRSLCIRASCVSRCCHAIGPAIKALHANLRWL